MESISSGREFDKAHLRGLGQVDLTFAAQNSYKYLCPIVWCHESHICLAIFRVQAGSWVTSRMLPLIRVSHLLQSDGFHILIST